jgi:hypothetical protein
MRSWEIAERVQQEYGEDLLGLLHRWYYDDRLTLQQIGDRIGVSGPTVWKWFRILEWPRRPRGRPAGRRDTKRRATPRVRSYIRARAQQLRERTQDASEQEVVHG